MAHNYIYINKSGAACTNLQGINGKYCFPVKVQCDDTDDDGFLMSCQKLYCDIKCSWEAEGEIPYLHGDKIMFQTQFKDLANPDPENPILGWGDWVFIEIWDAETGLQYEPGGDDLSNVFFSYVCHNGRNSFQVIEVDTDAEDFPCVWYAKFYAYKLTLDEDNNILSSEEVDCRQSHHYNRPNECQVIHEVEGLYDEFDCLGNYYGECENFFSKNSDYFKYRNTTKIEGSIVKGQAEVNNEDGNITIKEPYKFTTNTAQSKTGVYLPNFLIGWYANLFSAKIIKIDNISNQISNFALTYLEKEEHSAIPEFKWDQDCKNC